MSVSQPDGIDRELVDFGVLDAWMSAQGLPDGEFNGVERLAGGTQNLLIRFERGGSTYVLRRPPKHLRPRSNDNLRREARVLGALTGSGVAAPALIAACEDETVMGGAAFFLMESIDGFNASSGLPELHSGHPEVRHAMGLNAAAELARLGAVDHEAVGLADFGQPDGFLQRQVPRWTSELESYARHDGYPGPDIPGLDDVARWLEEKRHAAFRPGIMHGDYHLANLLYAFDGPRVAAIVDWEMCTIGALAGRLAQLGGLPGRGELVEYYAQRSARDLSAMQWYGVLACFKLGIVLEGTYARSCAGKADVGLGALFHTITCALIERAQTFIEEPW